MKESPFKFLDSYSKEDKDIYFGRNQEVDELYARMFQSKTLLLYGISGTGKSSLVHCGLSNRLNDADWLPISIRRNASVVESLFASIQRLSLSDLPSDIPHNAKGLKTVLRSLYLDYFKPIYIVFDQFEELFIFGMKDERDNLSRLVADVLSSDINCRFIFVIREEYLANLTEFEQVIPNLFQNRMRVEKMSHSQARETIEGPCKVAGISLQNEVADKILSSVSPDGRQIELTYLQVTLDRLYRIGAAKALDDGGQIRFTLDMLNEIGAIGDLLGNFLDEELSKMANPADAVVLLKALVSTEGTKRQSTIAELELNIRTFGHTISKSSIVELVAQFVDLRILRDKNENGRYELRHDALAKKIFEKITLIEKELLEVRQFIEGSFRSYQNRKRLLTEEDLQYVGPFLSKLFLNQDQKSFVSESQKNVRFNKRKKYYVFSGIAIIVLVSLSIVSLWAIQERNEAIRSEKVAALRTSEAIESRNKASEFSKHAVEARQLAEDNEKMALSMKEKAEINLEMAVTAQQEAEQARRSALNAKDKAERELYDNVLSSLAISGINSNVLAKGVKNQLNVAASGIAPSRLTVKLHSGEAELLGGRGVFELTPHSDVVVLSVTGVSNMGDTLDFGLEEFKVYRVPDPIATLNGRKSGSVIRVSEMQALSGLSLEPSSELIKADFSVLSYVITVRMDGTEYSELTLGPDFSEGQRELLRNCRPGTKVLIENVRVAGSDGETRILSPLIVKLK